MTHRHAAMLAAIGLMVGAASGTASATLPPDDTAGTGGTEFIRAQAETAAAEFFVTVDPTVTGVACVAPDADTPGVEMRCYGTNAADEVVTATARVNDYGDIEMDAAGTGGPSVSAPPPDDSATVLDSFTGAGSTNQPVDPITAPTIVRVTHDGAGEFSVLPQHGGVAAGEPVVTATGAVEGRHLVGLAGTISGFAVTADGAWTLELHAVSSAVPLAPGTPASGDTPDVVAYSGTDDGALTIEYTGGGPIVVRAVTSAGVAVLVDEPGPFTGDVTLPAGPGHLLVDAVGTWTITLPAPDPTTTVAAEPTTTPTTTAATAATAASTTAATITVPTTTAAPAPTTPTTSAP